MILVHVRPLPDLDDPAISWVPGAPTRTLIGSPTPWSPGGEKPPARP